MIDGLSSWHWLTSRTSDMADVELGWEVKGSISPAESVSSMLNVIANKGAADTGTFWCWNGMVSITLHEPLA